MEQKILPSARIPVATYRIQFNQHFTFADARETVAFLHELGISDLYSSPYFAAREGSTHGYDIVDHSSLNPELGTEAEYNELCLELRRFGMGQILDFVPNHMYIESNRNARWMDVLENGPCSPYAFYFDINWEPDKPELRHKVLLPMLSDHFGVALERGDLRLAMEDGAFFVLYGETRLPVEPASCLRVLKYRPEELERLISVDSSPFLEFNSIVTALEHLPATTEQDPDKRAERYREKEIVKKRLRQLCAESPKIDVFIAENIRIFNGIRGESRSFDLLDGLLGAQVYRLSYWRVAMEEINYRRFFDINGLAAIRIEDPAVFQDTHSLLFRLIREGKVTGVRVDHLDGLYDPSAYLRRLQKGCFVQLGLMQKGSGDNTEALLAREFDETAAVDTDFKPFYIVGEKILLKGERPPEEWPFYGTTGYNFLNALNGIFVDQGNAKAFDRIYSRVVRGAANFQEAFYEKKKLVMNVALSAEINTLGHYLNSISERDRLTRDFTLNSLTRALVEVIAFFSVYRTYTNTWPVRDKDGQYIEAAITKAKRRNPAISTSVFDFLHDILLLRFPDHATEGDRMEWLNFVMRFQQITGPVMAKGVEDTAFYAYNRLVSLNEVGGAPDRFGTPIEAFHAHNLDRARSFPHAFNASATHDTKRGEDMRARINALSEMPETWRKTVVSWSRLTKRKKRTVDGRPVPDRDEEYLLYQTIVGAWPFGRVEKDELFVFRDRVREYMIKSVREAKVNSSWINPDIPYEEALSAFIEAIFTDSPGNEFLKVFKPFQERIALCGVFTSLSQTLLKITSPGVPDFYQGTELWDLTMVDPDNRRSVDFGLRKRLLAELGDEESASGRLSLIRNLVKEASDGRVKLYLIWKSLHFRKQRRLLFEKGEYFPIEAAGERAANICAFARCQGKESAIVVSPRFYSRLIGETGYPLGKEAWLDTRIIIPPDGGGDAFRNIFTGTLHEAKLRDGAMVLYLADLLADFPVALLERIDGEQTELGLNP